MGSSSNAERSSRLDKQPRTKSAPIDNREKKTPLRMGRPYRTPSPSRAMEYIYEGPVSPFQMSRLDAIEAPMMSRNSSPEATSVPSTPILQRSFPNMFGLLTPGTPNFSDFNTGPTSARASCEVGDCDGGNALGTSASSETTAGDTIDMAKGNATGLDTVRQDIRAAQEHFENQRISEIHQGTDSGAEEPLQGHYNEIQNSQHATEEVVDFTVFGTRRSTRLAKQGTAKAPHPIIATPKLATSPDAINIPEKPTSSPKSSLASEAIVQLPPDPNSTFLTLTWDLQYPPGGSTHPSYRYPELDPRLLFNPSIIPIVNDLPNIQAVPPLILPMGWRHITWSSLLPIVFDPNHQAFKLTPIGPLPLTCEEVQQGGLARYVPGGECHPEAGLLPDLTSYSDGSDDIYNFDDTDWVLPFAEGEIFDAPTITEDPHTPGRHRRSSSTSTALMRVVSKPTTTSIYLGSRDCPDDIVDIEDAWRWIEHLEKSPNIPFVPSPTKSWRGLGIKKTYRKVKAPIPSLMGSVFKDVLEDPEDSLAAYLLPQNGRDFCPFKSVATPVHVDITLLKDVELTLLELLSYFPSHYMWRKAADRIVRAGMCAAYVANMINYTRVLDGDAARVSSSVNEQLWWQHEVASSRKRVKIVRDNADQATAAYTTEGWAYTTWELIDYPLLGLTHGLKQLPEGPDAGPLTAMIKWVKEQGRYDTLLSDVPALMDGAGIRGLIEPGEHEDPDKEVMGRFADVLKKDRKRVLKLAGEKRRAEEKEDSRRKKRVKSD